MMFLMLILIATAGFICFALAITRAFYRDWKRSLVCLTIGASLFILFGRQARQFHSEVKGRAKEYTRTHPRISEQTDEKETREPSNKPNGE